QALDVVGGYLALQLQVGQARAGPVAVGGRAAVTGRLPGLGRDVVPVVCSFVVVLDVLDVVVHERVINVRRTVHDILVHGLTLTRHLSLLFRLGHHVLPLPHARASSGPRSHALATSH